MLASCVRQQQAEEGVLECGALMPVGEVIGRGERVGADRDWPDFLKEEQDGAEKADALLAEIVATPAQSLAGVVAKGAGARYYGMERELAEALDAAKAS